MTKAADLHKQVMKLLRALDDEEVEPNSPPTDEIYVPRNMQAKPQGPNLWYVDKTPVKLVTYDSDNHHPIHDPYFEAAKIAFFRDLKPDAHVNEGDNYEGYNLSSFPKDPGRARDPESLLQAEFDSSQAYWSAISELADHVHLILGNHEDRINRLIREPKNVGLYGLRALQWPVMAALPSNVMVHPYGTRVKVGDITSEHGDRVGNAKWGVKYPDTWVLDRKPGRTTSFGHSHRVLAECRTQWEWDDDTGALVPVVYAAYNHGHGCIPELQVDWCPDSNWQKGLMVVEYYTVAGVRKKTVHLIQAEHDGSFMFDGRMYGGSKKWQ